MVENIALIYVPTWAPYEASEPETLGVVWGVQFSRWVEDSPCLWLQGGEHHNI